nr:MAG TPA: hypothetical protein [Caudoviricetes sp.]
MKTLPKMACRGLTSRHRPSTLVVNPVVLLSRRAVGRGGGW